MTGSPWHRDHSLDGDTVRVVIRRQFSQVEAATAEHVGDGCDFDAWEIDSRWLFRFPKRGEYAPLLLKEFALLDEIAPRLSLPVPVYQFRGKPCREFPWPFGGYEKLPGRSCLRGHLSDMRQTMARELGKFLTGLHSVTGREALRLAICLPDETCRMISRASEALRNLELKKTHVPSHIRAACENFLSDASCVPPEYNGPRHLTHNDLLAEHILVNTDEGRITGIIDWSDASVGDPADDFIGLWMLGGDELLNVALAGYGHQVDDVFKDRVRFKGICVSVSELSYGVDRGRRLFVDGSLACLSRTFGRSE